MLNISYTISPRLSDHIFKIENLRRIILLTPVSQDAKLRIRWEATLNKIYSTLALSGNPLKRHEMAELLSQNKKNLKKEEKEVISYKIALNYILQNWLGSSNPIDYSVIISLSKIMGQPRLSAPKEELIHLFEYLSAKQENPIIQGAIVFLELMKIQPFTINNQIISLLTSTLFLYKYGYDFRGFIAYEAEWLEDSNYFKENYKIAMNAPSLTLWIEYFALCILHQLEKLDQNLSKPNRIVKDFPKTLWQLNDRQKSILFSLDRPDTTITNMKIQKEYAVSQITASRDLGKLTNLGLLFSYGKGRSVYYTKA